MFTRVLLLLASTAVALGQGTAFPEPYDSEKAKGRPLSPQEAAASFRLPDGFQVTVFASEPEVRQPIAMAFDARGRLWVAENYTYAESGVNFATNLMDRIVILEDRDGDGRSDTRRVFWDRAQILTSVEPVAGGVYALCPPRLLFLADRDGDDLPDGPPEVVLDGFNTTTGNRHTFANGLKTGPDGWLWGRIGISSGARVGVPGAPEAQRIELRGGIWRYHPGRRVVEAVSHGTTNPWGLDWNAEGEPFFINTVIGHLWHAIPGAHFERMHGDDVMMRAYSLIPQAADHLHFDSAAGWTKSRAAADGAPAGASDTLGGGHAHASLMIYQGTNWPASYRDGLFTWNLHGRRANRERLERVGTGYVGRHEPDLLAVGDTWFRGIEMLEGPEGAVYLADWSDTGECHEHDGVHRASGRIYRISHGNPAGKSLPDFARATPSELAQLVAHPSEWISRQAIRALATRIGKVPPAVLGTVRDRAMDETGRVGRRERLRALWALRAAGGADRDTLLELSTDADEHLRSWAVRMLVDEWPADPDLRGPAAAEPEYRIAGRLEEMARTDGSGLVRAYLASAVQRMPSGARQRVALELARRGEDATDRVQPRLLWYGIEALAGRMPAGLREIGETTAMPMLRRFVARRLSEDGELAGELGRLLAWATERDGAVRADILHGMSEAYRGVRRAVPPSGWAGFAAAAGGLDGDAGRRLRELQVVFGDGRALDELKAILADGSADVLARKAALKAIVEARPADAIALVRRQVNDGSLRLAALLGLIELGAEDAAEVALGRFSWLGLEERPLLVSALASRVEGARALVTALEKGQVARGDIGAFQAGQILRAADASLGERFRKVWGTVRPGTAERRAEIARWKERLNPQVLGAARLANGRRVYVKACAGCHRLHGEGGDVGPDLTGSGRANLDYLLENVVDPGAVVAAEQRLTVVRLRDERVLSGLMREVTERGFVLVGPGGTVAVNRSDVAVLETLDQSAMPEGLLDTLGADEARDLVAYLMAMRQVPMDPQPGR